MREIKFRVWDDKRKDMVSWQELISAKEELVFSWISMQDENTKNIIEQFTGLHDKNGKEIYEGDICKHDSDINTIVFWEGAFIFNKYYIHDFALTKFAPCRTFEVIGNIHENPELLI